MPRFKDEIDRKLITLLQANSRESTSELARKLDLARSTVHERIARLERDGIISGFSVVLSKDPFTDYVQAVVMLSIEPKQSRNVLKALEQYPEVKLCLAISGEYDLSILLEAPVLADLDGVLDEIGEMPGVERTMSSIVLSTRFDRRYREVATAVSHQLGSVQNTIAANNE